jgi:hypothetical protein
MFHSKLREWLFHYTSIGWARIGCLFKPSQYANQCTGLAIKILVWTDFFQRRVIRTDIHILSLSLSTTRTFIHVVQRLYNKKHRFLPMEPISLIEQTMRYLCSRCWLGQSQNRGRHGSWAVCSSQPQWLEGNETSMVWSVVQESVPRRYRLVSRRLVYAAVTSSNDIRSSADVASCSTNIPHPRSPSIQLACRLLPVAHSIASLPISMTEQYKVEMLTNEGLTQMLRTQWGRVSCEDAFLDASHNSSFLTDITNWRFLPNSFGTRIISNFAHKVRLY